MSFIWIFLQLFLQWYVKMVWRSPSKCCCVTGHFPAERWELPWLSPTPRQSASMKQKMSISLKVKIKVDTIPLERNGYWYREVNKELSQKHQKEPKSTYANQICDCRLYLSSMDLVCMDFLSLEMSVGGYDNILVIMDHYTRFAQAISSRN